MKRRSFLALLTALLPVKWFSSRKPERRLSNLHGSQIRHTGFRMTATELANKWAAEDEAIRARFVGPVNMIEGRDRWYGKGIYDLANQDELLQMINESNKRV